MIESIALNRNIISKITNGNNYHTQFKKKEIDYLEELPLFKNNNDILNFKKGINILFAPNGHGKTEIVKSLAISTGCYDSGRSIYNKEWAEEAGTNLLFTMDSKEAVNLDFIKYSYGFKHSVFLFDIKKDSSKSVYCDPRNIVGSIKTHLDARPKLFSAIRSDCMAEKTSTGCKNINRTKFIIDIIHDPSILSGETILKDERNFEYHGEKKEMIELTKGNIEKSVPTIFLDEPESALDIIKEREFFSFLKQQQDREDIQIILVSHSPLCLSLDKANIITSDLDYLKSVKELINNNNYFSI